jgi:hypothetical protein
VPVPEDLPSLIVTHTARLGLVSIRDRTVSLILVSAAFIAWVTVGLVFTNVSPVGSAGAQLLGALLLGTAVGLTAWPLLWSAGQHADRPPGAGLVTAARRSGLIGLVITILVVLRALDAVALPVLIFIVVTAVLVELAFTLRH